MAWRERLDLRRERSKTYEDEANPNRKVWTGSLACLHYEDAAGQMQPVDMRPERVDTPAFDGYRVTAAGWHYALATGGDLQGWVGFGGKRGRHWLKFRLARVGYMHGPTRTFTDLGGAPTYDRANLSYTPHSTTIGPDGDELFVSAVAEWHNLWTTPNGGELYARWAADGDRLKEDVVINQAGREWLAANRPPTTPASQTWFGFVFQLDWSDVPRIVRQGALQDREADWVAGTDDVELRDAADELLALMPLDYVYVEGEDGERTALPLTRRFWKDPDSKHYLLVGAKVGEIAALPAGDLHFDPTVNAQVGAGADDASINPPWGGIYSTSSTPELGNWSGDIYHLAARFSPALAAGSTISAAYLGLYCRRSTIATILTKIVAIDEDDAAMPTTLAEFNADPLTSAQIDWDRTGWTTSTWYETADCSSVVQEVIDRGGWESGNHIVFYVLDDGSGRSSYTRVANYEDNSTLAPKLTIEYSEGASGVTVNAALGGLTLTGQAATITPGAVSIAASLGTLSLTGQAATVSTTAGAVTVNAATGALALAGQSASVTPGAVSTAAATGTLALTGQQASVVPGAASIAANAGSLTLAGQQAAIQPGAVSVEASAGALAVAGQQATVTTGAVSITAAAGALALTGQQASVAAGTPPPTTVNANVGALSLTGQPATVTTGAVSIAAAAGALTLTGQAATVSSGTIVNAAAGSLTLSGQQATVVPGAVTVAASTAALSLTGQQAAVTTDAPPVTVNAAAGTLTLTGQTATVTVGAVIVQAQPGSLALAGQTASIVPGAALVEAATALLSLAGQPATIDATYSVGAALATLKLAGQQASIVAGPVSIAASPGALTLTGYRAQVYEDIPHGMVSVTFTARAPSIIATSAAPGITASARQPSVLFDEEV